MNIKTVKQKFIEEGQKVLQYELDLAVGNAPSLHAGKINTAKHAVIVATMLELIKADTDIQKINVKNTADILKAIGEGKITITDAKEMVSLLALIDGKTEDNVVSDKLIIEIARGGAT